MRREVLLSAAAETFQERGCFDFKMDGVANSAGVAKGVLYVHFPSKEQFLKSVLRRKVARVLLKLWRSQNAETVPAPAGHRLALIAEALLTEEDPVVRHPIAPVQRLTCCLESHNSPGRAAGRLRKTVGRVIEEGQENGELAATLPASMLAGFFLDITLSQPVRSIANPGEAAKLAVAFFLNGSKGFGAEQAHEVSHENRDDARSATPS